MIRIAGLTLILIALFLLFTLCGVQSSTAKNGLGPGPVPYSTAKERMPEAQQRTTEIAESALEQIAALEAEKDSRTVAQQKIDSQLLYAVKMRRGLSISSNLQALTVAVGADDSGSVIVDINAAVDDQLRNRLREMSAEVLSVFPQFHSLRARTSLDQLEKIASFPQVRFIQPKQEMTFYQNASEKRDYPPLRPEYSRRHASQVREVIEQALAGPISPHTAVKIGAATSEGDTTHKAFSARGTFNTDGTGVKIGVLSDGVSHLATSQATGDLGPVTVLPGQVGSGDEGTAMLEIIHDLAPGAQLFFATAGGGIASFAQNIRDLRSAGCDIIVDDVGYLVESLFRTDRHRRCLQPQWRLSNSLSTMSLHPARFISHRRVIRATRMMELPAPGRDFADGGTLSLLPGGKVHDFDPSPTVPTVWIRSHLRASHQSALVRPLGASGNDYDLVSTQQYGHFHRRRIDEHPEWYSRSLRTDLGTRRTFELHLSENRRRKSLSSFRHLVVN